MTDLKFLETLPLIETLPAFMAYWMERERMAEKKEFDDRIEYQARADRLIVTLRKEEGKIRNAVIEAR